MSSGVRRCVTLSCLVILSAVATWIILWSHEFPENDVARVVAVGDLKTNGEHWVIFRFDAPKRTGALIANVQVSTPDGVPLNTYPWIGDQDNSASCFPDSTVRISEWVNAGKSKQFKVRHVGGGEWRVRLCLMLRLGFRKQYGARIEGCWRSKSLKPWTRNYVERNYRIIESDAVSTADSGLPRANLPTPPSPITPWSPTDEVFSLR